jgi:hypothetical protein
MMTRALFDGSRSPALAVSCERGFVMCGRGELELGAGRAILCSLTYIPPLAERADGCGGWTGTRTGPPRDAGADEPVLRAAGAGEAEPDAEPPAGRSLRRASSESCLS